MPLKPGSLGSFANRLSSISSELKHNICYFTVLLLGEFVFESGQELGVDLEHEALHFLDDGGQVCVRVARKFLHLAVPNSHSL